MERNGLGRARSALLIVLAVEVAMLVVTGIALFFLYRPNVRQAWGDLGSETTRSLGIAWTLRLVHQLASSLALWTSVAVGVVVALGASTGRRWTGPALGAGIATNTLLASFTGYLLPWDQLALWAVTAGTNTRGYTALFGRQVRFVLIGGTEVGARTILWWLLVHALVLGPMLVGLLVLAWRRRPKSAPPETACRGRRKASPGR